MTSLTGTGRLALTHLRTSWVRLTLCVLGLVGLLASVATSITSLYDSPESRLRYAASMALSPAGTAFNGKPSDLETLGGIVANEVGFMGMLAFPLVGVHLAVRLTRTEEDSGRTELLTAGRVGRFAPLAAAVVVLTGVLGVVTLGNVGVLVGFDLPVAGSIRYAAGLGLLAASFAGVGLLAAQLAREARTAYGMALGAVLASYLWRAVADGRDWGVARVSPMAWAPELHAWGAARAWPLPALAGLAVLAAVLAGVVAAHRDLGGGLLAPRPGPAVAARTLGSPLGYGWRFTRSALVGWLIGLLAWSGALGFLSVEMRDIVAANPEVLAALGVQHPEDVIAAFSVVLGAVGACALGVQGMARLAAEEESGRFGLLLSTRVPRVRLWVTWTALVVAEVVLVTAASGLAFGLSAGAATGDSGAIGTNVLAGLQLGVAPAFVTALAAAAHALAPRAVPAAWLLVAWAAVVAVLASVLRLPEWARHLSPVEVVGNVPVQPASALAIALLAAGALALVDLGAARVGRRDLTRG